MHSHYTLTGAAPLNDITSAGRCTDASGEDPVRLFQLNRFEPTQPMGKCPGCRCVSIEVSSSRVHNDTLQKWEEKRRSLVVYVAFERRRRRGTRILRIRTWITFHCTSVKENIWSAHIK